MHAVMQQCCMRAGSRGGRLSRLHDSASALCTMPSLALSTCVCVCVCACMYTCARACVLVTVCL